jgi:hypothetical protein
MSDTMFNWAKVQQSRFICDTVRLSSSSHSHKTVGKYSTASLSKRSLCLRLCVFKFIIMTMSVCLCVCVLFHCYGTSTVASVQCVNSTCLLFLLCSRICRSLLVSSTVRVVLHTVRSHLLVNKKRMAWFDTRSVLLHQNIIQYLEMQKYSLYRQLRTLLYHYFFIIRT